MTHEEFKKQFLPLQQQLYREAYRMLCDSFEAEDALQNLYLKLWEQKENLDTLIVGNVVAFIVAMLAIKFFINFVTKYGFKAFGWYRIIVGGVILIMLLTGHNLTII